MLNLVLSEFYFKEKIAGHQNLKSHFLPLALNHCKTAPTNWNCNVLTSRGTESIDFAPFLNQFKSVVSSMCDAIGTNGPVELRIESMWLNLYNENTWQETHNHSTHHNNISFVYFINHDASKDGEFFFLNERSQHYSASGLHDVFRLAESLNINELCPIKISEGDVILFPSHMRHGVTVQRHNTNRCTLAGNLLIIPQRNPAATAP